MTAERNYKLTVMLSDDEERMLRALADDRGLSSSDVLRQFLREAYKARWINARSAPLAQMIVVILNRGPADVPELAQWVHEPEEVVRSTVEMLMQEGHLKKVRGGYSVTDKAKRTVPSLVNRHEGS